MKLALVALGLGLLPGLMFSLLGMNGVIPIIISMIFGYIGGTAACVIWLNR